MQVVVLVLIRQWLLPHQSSSVELVFVVAFHFAPESCFFCANNTRTLRQEDIILLTRGIFIWLRLRKAGSSRRLCLFLSCQEAVSQVVWIKHGLGLLLMAAILKFGWCKYCGCLSLDARSDLRVEQFVSLGFTQVCESGWVQRGVRFSCASHV